MAIDEITEAQIWLKSTLSAHSGITAAFGNRISEHPAPRDFAFPRLTFFCLTPQDDYHIVGGQIFWSGLRFIVRGITQGTDSLILRNGVAAIQDALHLKWGATDNAYIDSCVRIRPFSMHEMADSVEYRHKGGEYLIKVRAKN